MEEVIVILTNMINDLHDLFLILSKRLGLHLTDKELHFWVMGLLGMVCFFIVHRVFRFLAKWSITSLSFIYTFTVMVVIGLAIEIQQKITERGNMEMLDFIMGLWGFLVLFAVYAAVIGVIIGFKYLRNRRKQPVSDEMSRQSRKKYFF